jgi:probable rRNA maturation factor
VLEVEVIGIEAVAPGGSEGDADGPTANEVEELCALALSSAGISDGHTAVEFVSEDRIQELNREFRGVDEPTDVLAFGVDEDDPAVVGPRELGDIVVCVGQTADVREAIIHGALHLTGMDHETDEGEMVALQAELMRWIR